MGMTLLLTDDETEALRQRAELEHRSAQEVASQAIREYVANRGHAGPPDPVVSEAPVLSEAPGLSEALPGYAGVLERLRQPYT